MKKLFMLFAAATLVFAACDKKNTTPEGGKEPEGQEPAANELYLTYDLNFEIGVATNYAGVTATVEGDKILSFFDMTEEEFFAAMGKFDFEGKAFVDNTLDFGNCYKEYGEWVYEWKAPTSSNVGYWMTADGIVCEWADGMFFTESQCWYFRTDVEVDDDFSYDLMWDFTVGFHEGNYTPNAKVGDKFSFTHFIFEEETGKTVYMTFNLNVTDYVDPELDKYNGTPSNKEVTVELTVGTPAPLEAIQEAFQFTKYQFKDIAWSEQITVTNYIDGVEVPASAGGFGGVWFDAEGKRTVWGTGAEDNPETPDVDETATPACYYIELISNATELAAYSGYYGEDSAAQVAGKTFNNFKQVVTYTPAEGESYTCTLNYNVKF